MEPARQHQRTREDIAREEIGRTDIAPWLARVLAALFLASIAGWPLIQLRYEAQAEPRAVALRRPPLHDRVVNIPARWRLSEGRSWPRRVFDANASLLQGIQETDDALDDASWLGAWIRPGYQAVLARWLGVGNEQAYVGRGGWLFFRPEVDHLTGPGFLNRRQLARRAAGGSEWQRPPQPDPVQAILSFHRALHERDIQLILLPVPVKPGIHPDGFHASYASVEHPLHNPSYSEWVSRLEREGVKVLDIGPLMMEARREEGAAFLATDTHWLPGTMERVARLVAQEISALPGWVEGTSEYRREEETVSHRGDIAEMLDLPEGFRPEPETVTVRPVLTARRELWRPDIESPVLLLGDSFSNIYSLPAMGWGAGAGLAEQIGFYLQGPVDRLVRNDDGAWATRQMLARELARGRDRLAGKRVVIWQFAARELSIGDWRIIPMELGRPPERRFLALEPGESVEVTATVLAASSVPTPGSVPYRDHILALHVTDIEGLPEMDTGEAVVYAWSMRDNVLQPAAFVRPGQSVTLELHSWAGMADEVDAINRSELDDWELQLQEPVWGLWRNP